MHHGREEIFWYTRRRFVYSPLVRVGALAYDSYLKHTLYRKVPLFPLGVEYINNINYKLTH